MPKQFFTEKDIEDLVRNGVKSLQVTDEMVLTELAYEKAGRLGLQLVTGHPDNPPAAPVRPYLSGGQPAHVKPGTGSASQAAPRPQPAAPPALREACPRDSLGERQDTSAIEQRIRSAVIAKLGDQVDAKLLDHIIHRVVKSTGLK